MARFVMANRISGRRSPADTVRSREALDTLWEKHLRPVSSKLGTMEVSGPRQRRVISFETALLDLDIWKLGFSGDVIVEPEILHQAKDPMPTAETAGIGTVHVSVRVLDDGNRPLEGAKVVLFIRTHQGQVRQLTSPTTSSGLCTFHNQEQQWTALSVIVFPTDGYWSMGVVLQSDVVEVRCPRLEFGRINWWQMVVGASKNGLSAGRGIRLGVIDSGVGPHPCLSHVNDLGSLINGTHDPNGGRDVSTHGTQVCGVIGSRPFGARQVAGVAPGVEIFSLRVEDSNGTANQGDVSAAIDLLAHRYSADLINLSLTSDQPSEIEHDAIMSAYEVGTLCLCAAGNSGGPVAYPAAFPEAVAVSAVGKANWAPNGTLAAAMTPPGSDKIGVDGFFLANFSCFGVEICCIAPGVGIITAVPEKHSHHAPFADCSGTSLAAPIATATLADLLSRSEAYKTSPRNEKRALLARTALEQSCRGIGLPIPYQGKGLPHQP